MIWMFYQFLYQFMQERIKYRIHEKINLIRLLLVVKPIYNCHVLLCKFSSLSSQTVTWMYKTRDQFMQFEVKIWERKKKKTEWNKKKFEIPMLSEPFKFEIPISAVIMFTQSLQYYMYFWHHDQQHINRPV